MFQAETMKTKALSGERARVILSEAKDPLTTCDIASRRGILRFAQDDTRARRRRAPESLRTPAILLCLIMTSLILTGCRPEQKMANQPSYKPYQSSEFFDDGMSARPLVEGTVSRGAIDRDPFLMTGKIGDVPVDRFPFEITEEVIVRGRERYDAYCSMCHGRDGYGRGMVVRRGFNAPPSFHTPEMRQKPVGHYFDVITNGYGAMPPHGSIVPVTDRWAIAAYLRALQLSQNPGGASVPATTPETASPATPAAQSEVSR